MNRRLVADASNRLVWNGSDRGHAESWCAYLTHRPSNSGFRLRWGLLVPSESSAPLMAHWRVERFDVERPQANSFLHCSAELADGETPSSATLEGRCGRASIDGRQLAGSLELDGGLAVRWDLTLRNGGHAHRYIPRRVSESRFCGANVVAPNAHAFVDGEIRVGDACYLFREQPAAQLHSWGKRQFAGWARSSCGLFREDPTASLQMLTLRLAESPIAPSVSSVALYLGGQVYPFNSVSTMPLARGSWAEGSHRVRAVGPHVKLECDVYGRAEELSCTQSVAPNGQPLFEHSSAVADAEVTVWRRRTPLRRFREYCRLTARASAYLEWGGSRPDPMVSFYR